MAKTEFRTGLELMRRHGKNIRKFLVLQKKLLRKEISISSFLSKENWKKKMPLAAAGT